MVSLLTALILLLAANAHTELIRSLRARQVDVLVIGLDSLKLDEVARARRPYARLHLPPDLAGVITRITTRKTSSIAHLLPQVDASIKCRAH
jgi:hypothetical protein